MNITQILEDELETNWLLDLTQILKYIELDPIPNHDVHTRESSHLFIHR